MRPGNGPYVSRPDSYGRYKVTINLTKELHERLMFMAREEGVARHGLILKMLEEGLVLREKRIPNEDYGTETYQVEREKKAKQE